MSDLDTIAAIATPPGRGGVGIIRVSGRQAKNIAENILEKIPAPRIAEYGAFKSTEGKTLDFGLALYFQSPNSFTGEDVLELQGHGGPIVLDQILKTAISLGARLAKPGEFSQRAFLNDKIDLAQAEAIADLIDSASEQAASSAIRSLQGDFSKRIHALVERLIHLRLYVEAAIDFPEEEVDFLSDGKVAADLKSIMQDCQAILDSASQGALLREGMTIVIAGRPNAGKSTLLNCLSGRESAIVTDIPGTTRDVMREYIAIDGLPLHIIDTAGLRDSSDQVEQEGIRRAWQEIENADQTLLLIDYQDRHQLPTLIKELRTQLPKDKPITVVINKIDLGSESARVESNDNYTTIYLSAKNKVGIDGLRQHLKEAIGFNANQEGLFLARRRHLEALAQAMQSLQAGDHQLHQQKAGELLAEDLRQAQNALSEITGEFTSDDLLGKIFSSFCIGK